jgi:hypothetical protein
VNHNERARINSMSRSLYSANLQTSYDAKQNVLLVVTAPFVNRNATLELAKDQLPNFLAAFRHDDDCGVFLDAVDQEVDCLEAAK